MPSIFNRRRQLRKSFSFCSGGLQNKNKLLRVQDRLSLLMRIREEGYFGRRFNFPDEKEQDFLIATDPPRDQSTDYID